MLKIDYTTSDSYDQCPRKCNLAHVLGWTSVYGSTALRFGAAFHGGMEGYYSHIAEKGWSKDGGAIEKMLITAKEVFDKESEDRQFNEDYRTFPNLVKLLTAYIEHFYQDEVFLEVVATERAFQILINPTPSDLKHYPWLVPFYFTGKIDQECQLNGMDWTTEFKTTGWSLQAVQNELTRSPQVMGYAYASRKVCNTNPEGTLVTIAYANARKSKVTGEYGKLSLNFARTPMVYNEHDLSDWRRHFIRVAANIQHSYNVDYWPPNFRSCFNYGRCQFLNICEQSRPLESASFHGYKQVTPWDVTKEIGSNILLEGEE